MKTSSKFLVAASVLALGLAANVTNSNADEEAAMEKCYGVVKARQYYGAGAAHSCAGQSSADGDANDFVNLPAGTCVKIAGGSLEV